MTYYDILFFIRSEGLGRLIVAALAVDAHHLPAGAEGGRLLLSSL